MKKLILFFLALSPILAQGAVRLRGLQYKEIAAPGFVHVCKLTNGTDYGYLIGRDASGAFVVSTINNGVVEKESRHAEEKDHGMFVVFLSIFERSGDYGRYLELRLEQKVDMNSGFMNGAVMLTESYYSKNEKGEEEEGLTPISKRSLVCNPVPL